MRLDPTLLSALAVPLLLLFILSWAVGGPRATGRASGFAWGVRSSANSDVSLTGAGKDGAGGVVATAAAMAALASLSGNGAGDLTTALLLAGLTGIASAATDPHGRLRAALYGIVGLVATAAMVGDVMAGACGRQVSGERMLWFAVVPIGALLIAGTLRVTLLVRRELVKDVGRLLLAIAVMIRGSFATLAWVPALGGEGLLGAFAIPVVTVLVLTVIGFGVGIQPRAGADLLGLGVLLLTGTLGVAGGACALDPMMTILAVLAMVAGTWLTKAVKPHIS